MPPTSSDVATRLLGSLPDLLPMLEAAYKDMHAHPELSMQETRTAGSPPNTCAPTATR